MNTDQITTQRFIDALASGAFDDQLEVITQAAAGRKRLLADMLAGSLKNGDMVQLHSLSPKYMNGIVARVAETPRGAKAKIKVVLDEPQGRFPAGEVIRIPRTCVDLVES